MTNHMTDEAFYHYRWWALIGLGMALVILNLDLTIVNLALPILGQTFHTKLSMLQWISNIYSLAFASLVMLTGKLADRYGHRLVYLIGVVFFFLGSCIAGFAPNVAVIILGRLFQGIGMAGTFGMVFILANNAFPPEQRGLAVGLLVALAGIAQAVGPTAGGMIIDHWGWRWAFWVNLPFCIVSFVLVYWICQNKSSRQKFSIHYPSALLLILIYFVVVVAFNEVQSWGATSLRFLAIMAAAIIVFAGVMWWQVKLESPYLDLKLFQNRVYRTISMARPLFQFNFGAFFFILPLYLQNVVGMTASESGLVMLIMTLALALSSTVAGRLNDYVSPVGPMIVAHLLSIFGFALLALMPILPINWPIFSIALVCIGVNVGIMYPTTNYAAIHSLPADKKGVGYGFFTANAYLFYSVGIALTGYLLSTIGLSQLNHAIASHFGQNSHLLNSQSLVLYTNGARPIEKLTQLYPQHGKVLEVIAKNAFSKSFSVVMWLFSAFSLIGLLFCFSFFSKETK